MTLPPPGMMCADCRVTAAAVQAGNAWVCWDCDEKASHTAEPGAFEMATVPAAGEDMRPEHRYDHAWGKLLAGAGKEDLVATFGSRLDWKRATTALYKRAEMAGLKLKSKRISHAPLKVRYRLKGQETR